MSADFEMSRIGVIPHLLSSVHVQLDGRGLLNPGYTSLTCVFSLESESERLLSHLERFLNALLQMPGYLCLQHGKPPQITPTAGEFSLLEISGARLIFSKRIKQKSSRVQCAILATVFETFDWKDKLSVARDDFFPLIMVYKVGAFKVLR